MAAARESLDGLDRSTISDSSTPKQTSLSIRENGDDLVTSEKMADPFEVRMKFTALIQNMNASVTSAQKAANYAMRYKDMDEDLHSCILEQLEKNNMNNRANIMYFLEHLCDMANREGHPDYIRMMQRDILRIVDAVAPEDGSGAANVKVVRRVLQGLQQKSFLLPQTVLEIESELKERDALPSHIGFSSPLSATESTQTGDQTQGRSKQLPPAPKLDKKQIEQRIEEDRERHKRLREHQWAIQQTSAARAAEGDGHDAEFDKMWDETSSLNSDDYQALDEEAEQREQCAREHSEEMAALAID